MSVNEALARWRDDTPGSHHRNHLNNAGAALMPTPVIEAIQEHIRLESEIGGYEAADARQDALAAVYSEIASLVGAHARNMAIVSSATAGFFQSMSAFDFARGDMILTSRCDYTSYQIHFLALVERLGIVVRHAPDLPEGGIDAEAVRAMLRRERVRLVHVSWVPTNSGLVQDVAAVGAVCEEEGVPFLVDACQAVGQIPIDVSRLACDYLSVTSRKFLRGPRGIGFLYVSDRAIARGDFPLFLDMRGARWAASNRFQLVDTAQRFEQWEFPHALVLGLGAAARYAADVGVAVGGRRAAQLAASLREQLASVEGVRVLDRGRERCAIVTMDAPGHDASALVDALARRRINTTVSLRWYGLIDFGEKDTAGAVRFSPHYYNSEAEIDSAASALRECLAETTRTRS